MQASATRTSVFKTSTSALTLVELLAVVAVLAVVAGIIAPVLMNGRRSAMTATDISNLRQIGMAQSIYTSENDGALPMSVFPLVDSGQIKDIRILRSPLDHTRLGFGYHLARELDIRRLERTDVAVSYPGVEHYAYNRHFFESEIVPANNSGWLICPNFTGVQGDSFSVALGTYRRLLFDGSVQARRMDWISGSTPYDQGQVKFFMGAMYFVDEDAQWASSRL